MTLTKPFSSQINSIDIDSTNFASRTSLNTVQDNVTALSSNVNVSNTWVNANDYSTLLTARSNDYNTLLEARSNDYATLLAARSNDYSTYTALQANINTVQSNLASASSNTQIYVSNTLLSNTSVRITAGDGVALTTNANASEVSFAVQMSNVTSQTFALSGSTNVFTIAKTANVNMVFVIYNGLVQDPSRYNISNTTLTLSNTEPLVEGANLEVRFLDFFDLPGSTSESGGGGESYSFQGSVSGYTSGGSAPSVPGAANTIDKFPFSADANASDVGDLTGSKRFLTGQSSSSSGYSSGGLDLSASALNSIDKFPFSTNANATDVGDLTGLRNQIIGQSSSTSGYTSGILAPDIFNTIDKFPFSSDGNATDVGDLTQGRFGSAGQSSSVSGYTSGGTAPVIPGSVNTIDKFPFASNTNATDVGDLTITRRQLSGQSSTSSGYNSGGQNTIPTPSNLNTIDKFSFSSDGNSTDVGDLSGYSISGVGQSSTTSGYTSGGFVVSSTIEKFPFATNANSTDVGDLTQGRGQTAGQQV